MKKYILHTAICVVGNAFAFIGLCNAACNASMQSICGSNY